MRRELKVAVELELVWWMNFFSQLHLRRTKSSMVLSILWNNLRSLMWAICLSIQIKDKSIRKSLFKKGSYSKEFRLLRNLLPNLKVNLSNTRFTILKTWEERPFKSKQCWTHPSLRAMLYQVLPLRNSSQSPVVMIGPHVSRWRIECKLICLGFKDKSNCRIKSMVKKEWFSLKKRSIDLKSTEKVIIKANHLTMGYLKNQTL